MALIKGKFIDPSLPIQQSQDPVAGDDVARKSYVDTKSESDAAAAQSAAEDYADDGLTLKQDSLGTGTLLQFLRGDLTWQEVPLDPDVVFAADLLSLPETGDEDVLYGTKDTNKLYRWAQGSGGLTPDWTVGASGDFASLEAALADAAVVDGDVISIEAGTYVVSAAIQVNKQVKIIGAGIGQTILETAGTSSDPVNVLVVSANNVLLKDMTIKHKKSTNSSIEAAVVVSAGSFPAFTYVEGFIMDSCRIEYCEFGIVMRGNGFLISNNQIAYATGSISNSNRAIGIYGQRGECFIVDNVFDNSVLNGTAFRTIYSSSTNASSNEECSGGLTIRGNTHLGPLQQFYNQDNIRGLPGDYTLTLKDNITNETSVFAVLYVVSDFQLDLFSHVILEGNQISNVHDVGTGTGKGMLAIDGAGSGLTARTGQLPVFAVANVLSQLDFRADYLEAIGSSGSLVGFKPAVFNPVEVLLDNTIPPLPSEPEIPGGASFEYVEVSPALIDDAIVDGITSRAPSQNAVHDALALKQNSLGTGTTAQYLRGDLTWQEVITSSPVEQVKYVSKNGVDAEADGSEEKPYLTISAAMAAITDASPTKRYGIRVAPGAYSEGALSLKPNVFIIGDLKEAVRVTATSVVMDPSFNQPSSVDNRSGIARIILTGACNFDWLAVSSPAGKLYFTEVSFGSAVTMNGGTNAIAQAQFDSCQIFGDLTISGINVGVFKDNICHGNVNLNQHPNGGMATIFNVDGGKIVQTLTLTTSVDDFNRRCSAFLKSCYVENLVVDGVSSYADVDLVSQGKSSTIRQNGGQLIALTPRINHDLETQMLKPLNNNSHNSGDWGKQWFFNFAYVHASAGTDLYLMSAMENYDPAGDSSGKTIYLLSDGYGLQENVDGGNIVIQTSAVSGTGVRGKIVLEGKEIDVSSIKITNLADAEADSDAVNKGQLDSAAAAAQSAAEAYADTKVEDQIVETTTDKAPSQAAVASAISALEAAISAADQAPHKESRLLTATDISNGYVDLAREAMANTMLVSVSGTVQYEDEDYTLSTVGGVTRVTFIGDLTPDDDGAALIAGDKVYFQYWAPLEV